MTSPFTARRDSLRWRVMSTYLLSAIAMLMLVAALVLWQLRGVNGDFVQTRVRSQVSIAAANISAAVMFEDWATAQEILTPLTLDRAVVNVTLLDAQGTVRLTLNGSTAEQSQASRLRQTHADIIESDHPLGRVVVTLSLSEVATALWRASGLLLAMGLLALSVSTMLVLQRLRVVLGPIGDLSALARTVQESRDYSLRANTGSTDEVGRLAEDVNTMLTLIEERDQALEADVRARTKELERKNRLLEREVTERRRLTRELAHEALHDHLTGLANRRAFDAEIDRLERNPREGDYPLAICLIDLDQFKLVNDTCGHAAGDQLLQEIGQIIARSTRSDDLVVRLGGDEFALVMRNCDRETATNTAERLRSRVRGYVFRWQDRPFRVGASIGVIALKEAPTQLSEAVARADAACFAAKDQGRNRVYVDNGTDTLIEGQQREMRLIQLLHEALDKDHFVLMVQPVVSLRDPDGPPRYEVLLRLADEGRLLSPNGFLPAAQRYGLLCQIDQWVVTHLIERFDYCEPDARYWVNLSGRTIGDSATMDWLEKCLTQSSVGRGKINFEVTETSVVQDIDVAHAAMTRLRAFGCEFALDDFGTGVSSYSYLKHLPLDSVKIDGSFVRGIVEDGVDRIFVKSMIDITRSMGLASVLEFVENEEILAIAHALDADYVQGYGLGRPRQLFPDEGVITLESAPEAEQATPRQSSSS